MNGMRSLLTTLSPTDSRSNCSVTIVLVPVLSLVPNCIDVWRSSWTILSLTTLVDQLTAFPDPWIIVLGVFWITLVLVDSTTSIPTQLVSHEFHNIGPNPVWGSIVPFSTMLLKVSA